MAVNVVVPPGYTNPDVDNIVSSAKIDVFSKIPASLQSDIANGQSATDVSDYINDALADAGTALNGALVHFPSGNFIAHYLVYPENISVMGSGMTATTITQPYGSNSPIFAPYAWANNITTSRIGTPSSFKDMGFNTGTASTGGDAIIATGQRGLIADCLMNNMGIMFTSSDSIGSPFGGSFQPNNGWKVSRNFINTAPLGSIRTPQTVGDGISDLHVVDNVLRRCGGPTVPNINPSTMNGWLIEGNKIEGDSVSLIDGSSDDPSDADNGHSIQIMNNLFDWTYSTPTSGTNVMINLIVSKPGRVNIQGNAFKASRLVDLTKNYDFLQLNPGSGLAGATAPGIVSGNTFTGPSMALTGTVNAFHVTSALVVGTSYGNTYNGLTSSQYGNGDLVWGPQYPIGAGAPSGTGMPGQVQLFGNTLYIANSAGVWSKYLATTSSGAMLFPNIASPSTLTIPGNTWVAYTDSTTHHAMLKFSDGTTKDLTP